MTVIMRLHPDFVLDRHVRDTCLDYARRSLSELRHMERHGLNNAENRKAYCFSVSW